MGPSILGEKSTYYHYYFMKYLLRMYHVQGTDLSTMEGHRGEKDTTLAHEEFIVLIKVVSKGCLFHVSYQNKTKNNPEKLGVLLPALAIVSLERMVSKSPYLLLEEMVRNQCS